MAAPTPMRRYKALLPLGNLEGEIITKRMLKNRENLSQKVLEFLQFCESLNRGQA